MLLYNAKNKGIKDVDEDKALETSQGKKKKKKKGGRQNDLVNAKFW